MNKRITDRRKHHAAESDDGQPFCAEPVKQFAGNRRHDSGDDGSRQKHQTGCKGRAVLNFLHENRQNRFKPDQQPEHDDGKNRRQCKFF